MKRFYVRYLIISSVIKTPPEAPRATVKSPRLKHAKISATQTPAIAEAIWSVAKKTAGIVITVKTAYGI